MINLKNKIIIITIGIILIVAYFFDKALFTGFLFVGILVALSIYLLYKSKLLDKPICFLFCAALIVHLFMGLYIYYANFQPFGGGDFVIYQNIAEQVSQRIHTGIFSLNGINYLHYYPVLMGVIYSFTAPKMIVSQLFSAWLAAVSVLLAYFLVLEVGGSKKAGFIVALMTIVYPSYVYFGSLMLKDTVVIPLVLLALLLIVKMLKNYSSLKFLAFFVVLTAAIHLRFYIGFALLFSFLICWFVMSNLKWRERVIYGLTFIFLLGFSPLILGYGYYGSTPLVGYLNRDTITTYREVVYAPAPDKPVVDNTCSSCSVKSESPLAPDIVNSTDIKPSTGSAACSLCVKPVSEDSGTGSSFVVSAGFDSPFNFIKNYAESFIYSLLGPFPWQLKSKKHLFFLLETIPWYLFLSFVIYGIYKSLKSGGFSKIFNSAKFIIPLLLFGLMSLGALSLFINNFGIIVRIRMPVLISFFSLIILNKNTDSLFDKAFDKCKKVISKVEPK